MNTQTYQEERNIADDTKDKWQTTYKWNKIADDTLEEIKFKLCIKVNLISCFIKKKYIWRKSSQKRKQANKQSDSSTINKTVNIHIKNQ